MLYIEGDSSILCLSLLAFKGTKSCQFVIISVPAGICVYVAYLWRRLFVMRLEVEKCILDYKWKLLCFLHTITG